MRKKIIRPNLNLEGVIPREVTNYSMQKAIAKLKKTKKERKIGQE